MAGLVPAIHVWFFSSKKEDVEARHEAGHDEQIFCAYQQARSTLGPSSTISGCRASDTAGDIRITSACAPKIAAAR